MTAKETLDRIRQELAAIPPGLGKQLADDDYLDSMQRVARIRADAAARK